MKGLKIKFYWSIIFASMSFVFVYPQTDHLLVDCQFIYDHLKQSIIYEEFELASKRNQLEVQKELRNYYPSISVHSQYNQSILYDQTDGQFFSSIYVNFNLFNWSKILFQKKILKQLEKQNESLKQKINLKAFDEALDFYMTYSLEAQDYQLTWKKNELYKKLFADSEYLYNKGQMSLNEFQKSKNQFELSQDAVLNHQQSIETLKQQFSEWLNIEKEFDFAAFNEHINLPPLPHIESLYEQSLNQSKDLYLLNEQLDSLKKSLDKSFLNRMGTLSPSIHFSNSFSLHDFDFERDKEDLYLNCGLSWNLPVYDAGREKIQKKIDKIDINANQISQQKLKNKIFKDLKQLLADFDSLTKMNQLTQGKYTEELKAFQNKENLFDSGLISKRELDKENLILSKTLIEYRQQKIQLVQMRAKLDILRGEVPKWLFQNGN